MHRDSLGSEIPGTRGGLSRDGTWSNVSGPVLRLLRPQQWIKNLVVFAAIIFSGNFLRPQDWISSVQVFVALCLLSSAVYVLNDLYDADSDRLHPKKRLRPIASGAVATRAARHLFVGLTAISLAALLLVNGLALLYGVLFLLLNVAYTLRLKRLFLLDAFSISAGFILRAMAGASAIRVPISPWLFVLLLLLTLFLALGKRRSEMRHLRDDAGGHRAVLDTYTVPLLDQFLPILGASVITIYTIYAYGEPMPMHLFVMTVPFVVYGLFRYLYLLSANDEMSNPDELLVHDMPTLINLGMWALISFALLLWRT